MASLVNIRTVLVVLNINSAHNNCLSQLWKTHSYNHFVLFITLTNAVAGFITAILIPAYAYRHYQKIKRYPKIPHAQVIQGIGVLKTSWQ